jgi:hypothetical protein
MRKTQKKPLPKISEPAALELTELEKILIQNVNPGYKEIIILKEFSSGYGGARVFSILPIRLDDGRDARVVTKVGLAPELRHEYENYQKYAGRALPFTVAQVREIYEQDDYAALNYMFAGGESLGNTVTLEEYYRAQIAEEIKFTLENLLDKALGVSWYAQCRPLNCLFRAEYGWRIPAQKELERIVAVLFPDLSFVNSNLVRIPGVPGTYPYPLKVYPSQLDKILQGRKSYVHGDLHLRNILVDETGKGWLIDFANVEERHNLLDFIKLETYLRLMMLGPEHGAFSWNEYIQFEQALNAVALGQTSKVPANPYLEKAYKVIQTIRQVARKYMGANPDFNNEYFPALFLYCLARLKHHETNGIAATQLIFLTACICAQGLLEDVNIGGGVKVDGDFVGRDKVDNSIKVGDITNSTGVAIGHGARVNVYMSQPAPVDERSVRKPGHSDESIRLDVAAPEKVEVNRAFEVAVRVSRPDSLPLSEGDLTNVMSHPERISHPDDQEIVRYRVEVSAPDCEPCTSEHTFLLRLHQNSEVIFFLLAAKREGNLPIVVTAYQEDELVAAQTRIRLKAVLVVQGAVQAKIVAVDKTLLELKEQFEQGHIDAGQYFRLKAYWEQKKNELETSHE